MVLAVTNSSSRLHQLSIKEILLCHILLQFAYPVILQPP